VKSGVSRKLVVFKRRLPRQEVLKSCANSLRALDTKLTLSVALEMPRLNFLLVSDITSAVESSAFEWMANFDGDDVLDDSSEHWDE
jgi:hypothetical protein